MQVCCCQLGCRHDRCNGEYALREDDCFEVALGEEEESLEVIERRRFLYRKTSSVSSTDYDATSLEVLSQKHYHDILVLTYRLAMNML